MHVFRPLRHRAGRANRAWLSATLALSPLPLLGGCNLVVMDPSGDIARQQANLIVASTALMLLIVLPVMAMIVFFAWKYRQSNKEAAYEPDWDHSTALELVIWSAPLLIIIALGALTWISTHTLDPYRPISRIAPGKPIAATDKPLEIGVVSLDWKWLFIYPEQGIATVNELVIPANRQVRFRLTSSSVMNAFYVPAMAGMIYTMPGMETKLHAVMNREGTFEGMSSNYSGAGFSYMHFPMTSTSDAGFDRWVAGVRAGGGSLDRASYTNLVKPSEKVPAMHFASVTPGLFDRAVNMCVEAGKTCMIDTMMKDMGHPHEGGVIVPGKPVNDANQPGSKGALMKSPKEKGTSPHLTAPHGAENAPGSTAPGSDANRNMTKTDETALPGRPAPAPKA